MNSDYLALLPYALLAGGGVTVFCLGMFRQTNSGGILWTVSLVIAALTGLSQLWPAESQGSFSLLIDSGSFGRFFGFTLSSITVMTLLFMRHYAEGRGFAGDELYGILLFATLGMLLTAAAANWIVFFLGIETLSISLYVLISIHRQEPASGEAGLKYLMSGAFASSFLTFGLALFYAASGTLSISVGLSRVGPDNLPLALLAFGFILTGLAFKISAFPFHLWTPDVYQGAPAPVTAFLSTGSKVAVFAVFSHIMAASSGALWSLLVPAIWILSLTTMAAGNITALWQTSLKRRLAFSSIGQMGYLLLGLLSVKTEGLPAIMFYLPVYAVMDLGAFGILGSFAGKGQDRDRLKDYKGLGYACPWRAGIMTLCLISLAGLPPTAGFIGKFLIFKSALASGFQILAVIGILTVIVSLYYYLEVTVYFYMKPGTSTDPVPSSHFPDRAAWALVMALVLILGILPSSLISLIRGIASTVTGGPGI